MDKNYISPESGVELEKDENGFYRDPFNDTYYILNDNELKPMSEHFSGSNLYPVPNKDNIWHSDTINQDFLYDKKSDMCIPLFINLPETTKNNESAILKGKHLVGVETGKTYVKEETAIPIKDKDGNYFALQGAETGRIFPIINETTFLIPKGTKTIFEVSKEKESTIYKPCDRTDMIDGKLYDTYGGYYTQSQLAEHKKIGESILETRHKKIGESILETRQKQLDDKIKKINEEANRRKIKQGPINVEAAENAKKIGQEAAENAKKIGQEAAENAKKIGQEAAKVAERIGQNINLNNIPKNDVVQSATKVNLTPAEQEIGKVIYQKNQLFINKKLQEQPGKGKGKAYVYSNRNGYSNFIILILIILFVIVLFAIIYYIIK